MAEDLLVEQGLLRRSEEAHYDLQSALYLTERRRLPGFHLVSGGVPEPEWNHAALVSVDAGAVAGCLGVVRDFFGSRNLPATIAVGPFTEPADLGELLIEHGFERCWSQTWHFLTGEPAPPPELGDAEIVPIRNGRDMAAYVGSFEEVYSLDLETGEPQAVPAGYSQALWRSFRRRHRGLEVVHYLARVGGEPAGGCTSIHGREGCARGVSGLYNLVVRRAFRRRGLGAALVHRRAADALALGQEIVFLQTERASVERRLGRRGFEKGFVTVGYTETVRRVEERS